MIVTISQAADIILKGGILAIPTETVYGLAADAFNVLAVKKTFEAKGRPADNPLIVHISNLKQMHLLCDDTPEMADLITTSFWPGPLTIVLNKKQTVPDVVTGGLHSVAIRMPDHPTALELIEQTGPLTAPSANKSGRPSATRPEHITSDFGKSMPILEGNSPGLGIESTVLDLRSDTPLILRPGSITVELIEEKTGIHVLPYTSKSEGLENSPGTRYTHYRPAANVQIIDHIPTHIEGNIYYIIHSSTDSAPLPNVYNYLGDFDKLAQDLYDHFRQADHLGYSQIMLEELPDDKKKPIISALRDRISRASS